MWKGLFFRKKRHTKGVACLSKLCSRGGRCWWSKGLDFAAESSQKLSTKAPFAPRRRNLKTAFSLWKVWKRIIFFVHSTSGEFKNATISGHFAFVFEENSSREIAWLSWHQCFRKAPFSKCFPSTSKRQAGVSNWGAFSKSKFLRCSVGEADKFRAPKTKIQPIRLFLMSYVHPSKCQRSGY